LRRLAVFQKIVYHRFHGHNGRFLILKPKPEHLELLPAGQSRESRLLAKKSSKDRIAFGFGRPLSLPHYSMNQGVPPARDSALVYQTRRGRSLRMLLKVIEVAVAADDHVAALFPAFADDQEMHAILRRPSKLPDPPRELVGNAGSDLAKRNILHRISHSSHPFAFFLSICPTRPNGFGEPAGSAIYAGDAAL
jgi:hypothetical protein